VVDVDVVSEDFDELDVSDVVVDVVDVDGLESPFGDVVEDDVEVDLPRLSVL
jgi:hypothetical protein